MPEVFTSCMPARDLTLACARAWKNIFVTSTPPRAHQQANHNTCSVGLRAHAYYNRHNLPMHLQLCWCAADSAKSAAIAFMRCCPHTLLRTCCLANTIRQTKISSTLARRAVGRFKIVALRHSRRPCSIGC